MQYLLLLYDEEGTGPEPGDPEFGEMMAAYTTFTEQVIADGVYVGGQALESSATATSVRVRDGKTQLSDGPFAETKEVLGGYYLLDCESLDQALDCAARIPAAKHGTVEVRPIMQLPEVD